MSVMGGGHFSGKKQLVDRWNRKVKNQENAVNGFSRHDGLAQLDPNAMVHSPCGKNHLRGFGQFACQLKGFSTLA